MKKNRLWTSDLPTGGFLFQNNPDENPCCNPLPIAKTGKMLYLCIRNKKKEKHKSINNFN